MIKVDVRAPDIMFEVKVTLQKILSIKVDEELEILVASNMTLLSSNITLYSDYCTWFIALLASPYILFSTWRCLFFGWVWKFSLHQHSVWVARTCAKYALWTMTMSFHKCLSILMRLKAITSIYNHYCTCLPQVWLVQCLPVDCWVC